MKSNTEVVIMVTEKNMKILPLCVKNIKKNVSSGNIYVVANKELKDRISKITGVTFFDEDKVVEGMTFDTIADLMKKNTGNRTRTGWYFQQFLKLGWSTKTQKETYIVVDADTLILCELDFFDLDEKFLFTQKIEYNKPYFDTIEKLFDGELVKQGGFSFVAEHMMFDCKIVKEMLNEIIKKHPERGNSFYEVIMNSINKDDLPKSGFSEFETYGTYIFTKYPEIVKLRKLRTLREAVLVLGDSPTESQLEWAAKDYDIISLELPKYKSLLTKLTSLEITRKAVSLKTIADSRKKVRSIYRKLIGKKDFVYD